MAVCTLSEKSSVKVSKSDVQVRAARSCDNRTVTIKDPKVVENLNITTTRAKDLTRWPHLRDIEIPNVDEKQVTMLIGANVAEAQVHEECRIGRLGKPYAVRTVLEWAVPGPVDVASSLCLQEVNVNFVKYGSELSDQQIKQFLRLRDIDINKSSKKGLSV